ncbi:type I restriction enzyme M protein [Clostridium neonatale]|nr:type I restriction enzyme M protein [Clostridium neonatale]
MDNLEKLNNDNLNKIWKWFNAVSGEVEISEAQKFFREIIFLKSLSDKINDKNKYYTARLSNAFDLKICLEDKEEFFNSLTVFIESNECLKDIVFEIFTFNHDAKYKHLCESVDILSNLELTKDIDSALLFKEVIRTIYKDSKRDVTTSPSINEFISRLFKNIKFKTLYDPVIGRGILAFDVAYGHKGAEIYGQDISKDVLNICKMLLILDERIEEIPNITLGNTISNPGNIEEGKLKKFDCIVANPPFGLKEWGYNEVLEDDRYNRFHRGIPSKSSGDYAFISHIIESMNKNGTAAVIVTTGVLFKEGAEGEIRKQIINENLIDAVISLPNNMMYGTAIPVNIIIFKKNKKEKDVLFIDTSSRVENNRVLTRFTDVNIEEIADIYERRIEIEGLSKKIYVEDIEKNDYNLNVSRYITVKKEREKLDIEQIGNTIHDLLGKLNQVQNDIDKILK